jgi:hypothetical protein
MVCRTILGVIVVASVLVAYAFQHGGQSRQGPIETLGTPPSGATQCSDVGSTSGFAPPLRGNGNVTFIVHAEGVSSQCAAAFGDPIAYVTVTSILHASAPKHVRSR